MELKDLSRDEQIACVALVSHLVLADQETSGDEAREIDKVAEAFGDDVYRELLDEADERFTSDEKAKAFLGMIDRQEARNLIYGTVLEAALASGVDAAESEMLTWLEKHWHIDVEYTGDTPEGLEE